MTAMQYAVDLREVGGQHTILRHVLAESREKAAAWAFEVFGDFSLTRSGETEVVIRPLTHPERVPEGRCAGSEVVDELIDGTWTHRACPGCPDCHRGGAR